MATVSMLVHEMIILLEEDSAVSYFLSLTVKIYDIFPSVPPTPSILSSYAGYLPRHNTEENQIYVYDFDVGVELRWDGESVAKISLDSRYHGKTKGADNHWILLGKFDRSNLNFLQQFKVEVRGAYVFLMINFLSLS